MFFAFPKPFFRSKSNNEKGGKKAKFTRLSFVRKSRESKPRGYKTFIDNFYRQITWL